LSVAGRCHVSSFLLVGHPFDYEEIWFGNEMYRLIDVILTVGLDELLGKLVSFVVTIDQHPVSAVVLQVTLITGRRSVNRNCDHVAAHLTLSFRWKLCTECGTPSQF